MSGQTLFEKVWDAHVVAQESGAPAILYIDAHLVHEVTSPQAFNMLRARNLTVRRPDRTFATMDHAIPTRDVDIMLWPSDAAIQVRTLRQNCEQFGITLFDIEGDVQGIVHVVGPEMGITQPGMTIVCGDSHTATHGAFGALAFGIGTSEVEMVLATQTLLQYRPKTFRVNYEGRLRHGVTSKDMILALIAKNGVGGGTGHVFEYMGDAVRALGMEARMTMCNMSIEGGARAGMIAPDDTTFEYIAGRDFAPKGVAWDKAVAQWRTLRSDDGATYDKSITIDVDKMEPMITYGTNPGMGMPINGRVPDPATIRDSNQRQSLDKALTYMDLQPGQPLIGQKVDVVFVGSCTNSRMTDLREAAAMIDGRKVADNVRMMIVPGSEDVRRQAEAEGLHEIFQRAGAEWRSAGCSMCIAMNGDQLAPGQYAVSTSNRNFEGRQGKGGRTFLASPLTAVASAVNGVVTDPRTLG
ncbi:MAG: 3-isopropylmalate dehydratase large subunit [Anaerolineae bacterium]|nr:3-isopropylmalate dehydratase large subunit [Anaerolineae bacterium]